MKRTRRKAPRAVYKIIPFILLFMVIGAVKLLSVHAATASGTYTNIYWPTAPTNGYNSLEYDLKVDFATPAADYFWSHQVSFVGGGGGYFGMQDGTYIALFSLWDTVNARGPNCGPFGGEGVGMHCSIAYNWVTGRTYHLKLAQQETDSNGTWWQASIQDTTTGVTSIIGAIENLPGWTGLTDYTDAWTEYFGPTIASCNLLPNATAEFTNFKMNGNISPTVITNGLGSGDCTNSVINAITGGAKQRMGNVPGDMDGNGHINALDFSILATNYGSTNGTLITGDFNNDHRVNILDLSIFANYYGQ